MKCAVCNREFETQLNQLWVIQWDGVNVCHDCCKWLNSLERVSFTTDEYEFILRSVFEYIQEANCKYIECMDRLPTETERTLHYKDIMNMGHAILIKLSEDNIDLDYNMEMYIKEVARKRN